MLSLNTIMFRTLTCEDFTRELHQTEKGATTAITIEPSEIEVEPLRAVQFFFAQYLKKVQIFEISTNFMGLHVFSNEAEIQPDETIAINTKLRQEMPPSRYLKIIVMYERGKIVVPIQLHLSCVNNASIFVKKKNSYNHFGGVESETEKVDRKCVKFRTSLVS